MWNPPNRITAALLFRMALASSPFGVRQSHTAKAVAAVTVVTESEISFIGSTSYCWKQYLYQP